jgi:hypothetical protein
MCSSSGIRSSRLIGEPVDRIPEYLFASALAGLVLWQLITGKALDRSWHASVSRKDNPGMYWAVVLVQSAFLMVILLTGKASWHIP